MRNKIYWLVWHVGLTLRYLLYNRVSVALLCFFLGGLVGVATHAYTSDQAALERVAESRAVQGCEIAAIQMHRKLQSCEYHAENCLATADECVATLELVIRQKAACVEALRRVIEEPSN